MSGGDTAATPGADRPPPGRSNGAARSGSNGAARSGPDGARVALVSGGNRGIGLGVVRRLAERGMRVVLGTRSRESGQAAVEVLGDVADRVAVRQLDVTDPDSVARLAQWLGDRLGRCDVLVNAASVLLDDAGDGLDLPLDVARRTLETNLLGTWRLTQAIVPLMRARHYGRIVNISSDLGSLAGMRRGFPAYRVSKAAVHALTRTLADELAGDGILVNACCPSLPSPERAGAGRPLRVATSFRTPLWLATLPQDGPTGGFYRSRVPVPW
ncbi:SDR family NAD(P)-dependent oxidoreductase [Plantactinospora sp. KBS50]|uniref:SDR family NAD(P)-dependent oxidoreductase n=1 Tax=Plantactinospora sp. KBS50 TaxID=2024580 RepID=UPI000BAA9CD1|nr:SDR family NAD(P)-dependent oxidoreductase [Plantactinospora sp. KBS50]ASW54331.1 hypothetical protein CIK06_09190 [Plantactinospora sp. KBS50]